MFNNTNGYSLADIAAATGNGSNGGFFGGDGAWWIIILFLFCFAGGWGNNGWGGNGGGLSGDLAYSFDMNGLQNGQTSLASNLANGFYNLNTGLLNSTNAIQTGINGLATNDLQNTFTIATQLNNMAATNAQCCCENKMLVEGRFADLNYNLATVACQNRQTTMDNARDIIDNQNANTRSILDFLIQDKLDTLHAENADLRGQISQANQNAYLIEQLRPTPYPSYLVENPYYSPYTYGYNRIANYNTGCTCGTLA